MTLVHCFDHSHSNLQTQANHHQQNNNKQVKVN